MNGNNSKSGVAEAVSTENQRGSKKLMDAIQQQQERHSIKMKRAEAELLMVKLELKRAELQKQEAEFDRQRHSDEAELASLKLKQLRKMLP